MAAGLGFKTFTSGEVLNASDVNGYLMQGVLVFASAAARDAAITSPQEGQFAFTKDTNGLWYYDGAAWVASGATGDIEGVTAGIGISGGGTSGTVTVTNSMATAIDAKGDLVAGTGADTFAKLTVGANNTVLTADSAEATGLKWATPAAGGGMTLISTTAMTGSSITLSSIPSTYKNLNLIIRNPLPSNDNVIMSMRFNGDSGTNYAYADTINIQDTADVHSGCILNIGMDNGVAEGMLDIKISDYTNAVSVKFVNSLYVGNNHSTSSNWNITGYNSVWDNTAAITSITLFMQSGTMTSGSVLLYGVS